MPGDTKTNCQSISVRITCYRETEKKTTADNFKHNWVEKPQTMREQRQIDGVHTSTDKNQVAYQRVRAAARAHLVHTGPHQITIINNRTNIGQVKYEPVIKTRFNRKGKLVLSELTIIPPLNGVYAWGKHHLY